MSPDETTLAELRQQAYAAQANVDRLRREVYQQYDPSASQTLLDELAAAEDQLTAIEAQIGAASAEDPNSGLILESRRGAARRGRRTTGLEATVHLRMAQVPTSYYHLLQADQDPLISCKVTATDDSQAEIRRVRVSSYIEGYSAAAVNTFEVARRHTHTFDQLPVLFADRVATLTELTRASLNIKVEDLDSDKVEIHETHPIWLLARTTAPLSVRDPQSGQWRDMMRYFGAFVTPNAPSLMRFLRTGAQHHPQGRLVGYQGDESGVTSQVKALFDALKAEGNITYVNSLIDFSPEQGFASQRVRLPRESLETHQANCIDGTVLFASLLEGISLNPAIVIVPGHAFLAWETWRDSGKWKYVETTMIGTHGFEQACTSAEGTAAHYCARKQLKMYPLNELRATHGIMPME
ncbi:MAG: hypothetical protein JXA09_02715 [Anaerolineae bacterium]|nr:hypothetical protein [Anaerolineae bacterium]